MRVRTPQAADTARLGRLTLTRCETSTDFLKPHGRCSSTAPSSPSEAEKEFFSAGDIWRLCRLLGAASLRVGAKPQRDSGSLKKKACFWGELTPCAWLWRRFRAFPSPFCKHDSALAPRSTVDLNPGSELRTHRYLSISMLCAK